MIMTDHILKQPSYQPVIGTFATKVKMQDAVEFYETRCPNCHGTMVSLKVEDHKRIFCPNCTPNEKYGTFQKLNRKLLESAAGNMMKRLPRT